MKPLLTIRLSFVQHPEYSQNLYYGNVAENGMPVPGASFVLSTLQDATTSILMGIIPSS